MDFSEINPHTARIFLPLLQQIVESYQLVYHQALEEKKGIARSKDYSELASHKCRCFARK